MEPIRIETIESLIVQLEKISQSDPKIKKLFEKQKQFMERYQNYPSLGRKKLENVEDQFGNALEEIRLNKRWRIVFIVKDSGRRLVWLKICNHDELSRKNRIIVTGHNNL